jgi:hypothetical protein
MSSEHLLAPVSTHPILPTRLEWLCQPEHIEYTLSLLFHLNAWKRAYQQLLYADRQGLQEIQALVLEAATSVGQIQAVAYLDESSRFPSELRLETAADDAARGVLIHVRSLNDPEIWPPFEPDGSSIYQRFIRPLYRRITGQDFPRVADALPVLRQEQLRAYIQKHLDTLVKRASKTRQPIPLRRLARLCLAPVDLLPIRDNRLYFFDSYDTWGDLDGSDLRKLDPEGESQIAFQYASATAEYMFHLPFRRAERFLPARQLRALPRTLEKSQERALFKGIVIDEAESVKHPAKDILQDLGVDIARVCPHKLLDKATYLAQPAIRDILWPTRGYDDEGWENDPWDGLCLPPTDR